MLADLQKLLELRREREGRAARDLAEARQWLAEATAEVLAAEKARDDHHRACQARRERLYRASERNRMTKCQIDDLNIQLDLMIEEVEALQNHVREAKAVVDHVMQDVEAKTAIFLQHRKDSDRWNHLVDDVAETQRRESERAEELAFEDELGDRRPSGRGGQH